MNKKTKKQNSGEIKKMYNLIYLNSFCIANHYIKMDKTSWTYSNFYELKDQIRRFW